jgi:hypothetical protein
MQLGRLVILFLYFGWILMKYLYQLSEAIFTLEKNSKLYINMIAVFLQMTLLFGLRIIMMAAYNLTF